MKKFTLAVLCFFIGATWAIGSYAQDINSGICNNCNSSMKANMATTWAWSNVPRTGGIKKLYHVLDTKDKSIVTYEVYIYARYQQYVYPYGYTYQPIATIVPTPNDVNTKALALFHNTQSLKTSISDLVIPNTVIESPWQFVNCSYCANDVADFIRQNGELDVLLTQLQGIGRWLGLTNDFLVDTYVISLENGGKIEITLSLTETSVTVKVNKVTDADNNDVPLSSSGISDLQIRVYYQRPDVINYYLVRFGFILGGQPNEQGIVTIEECRHPQSPDNGLPPCS